MTTLTEAILQANGDRELIQQAILAHAQAGKQHEDDNRDGVETDAQFIEDWQNSEYVKPRGFTAYFDPAQWQYFDHLGRDTDELKTRWSAYLDGLSPLWRHYSGQYVDEAIEHGNLHKMVMPPTNGDPLE